MVATIGCYSVRNSMIDVYMLWAVALVGYALRKLEFQLAPLVVGVVLGPLIEKHLREGLFMSLGDVSVFYTSSIAIGIWSVVIIVLLLDPLRSICAKLFGIKVKKIIPESSE
jgi:putative tricarboxylic transport membrane protein